MSNNSNLRDFKISVYITSYNQKEYLFEAIESVLAQTLAPYEIIIIDDCSEDGSQELINSYASRFPELIKPIYHSQNYGVGKSRTDALMAVTGEFISYVDGDDRFLPTKLETEMNLLQINPDARIAYSNFFYIGVDGSPLCVWAEDEVPPQGDVFRQVFARDFPRGNLFRNELIAHSCLNEINYYDPDLTTHEDWDFKIRLTKKFRVVYCPSPLVERRRNPIGLSHRPAYQRLKFMKKVYEKNRNLLEDLSTADRIKIENNLSFKFSRLAWHAVKEEIKKGNPRLGFRYFLEGCHYIARI